MDGGDSGTPPGGARPGAAGDVGAGAQPCGVPSTVPNRRLPGDQRPEVDRSRRGKRSLPLATTTELAAALLRNAGTVSDPQMAEVVFVVEPPGAREGAPAEPTANADVLRKLPQVWLLTMSCQFAEDLAAPDDGLSKDGHRPRPCTAGATRAVPVRWIAGVWVKMHLLSLAYPRYPKYLHPTRLVAGLAVADGAGSGEGAPEGPGTLDARRPWPSSPLEREDRH